jgi:hypothetical protein
MEKGFKSNRNNKMTKTIAMKMINKMFLTKGNEREILLYRE